jgi:CubicO group peptidase (beta-lactamase class C family)
MRTWTLTGLLATTLSVSGPTFSEEISPAPQPGPAQLAQSESAPESIHALSRVDLEPWLDGFLPYALQRADIAGAVVVVVKGGTVLLQKGYGHADAAAGRTVDPERTLFRPGSISKLFTWTAVMQLVEQHRIDLDRDVNSYIDFRIPAFDGKPVTMRELMTHTAGFENALEEVVSIKPSHPELGDFLKHRMPQRIFPAGEMPAYSNYGAALAGYIVERVSGQPFALYAQQHILAPLGMTHSTFIQPPPDAFAPLLSHGYLAASGEPGPFEMLAATPAGGLTASAADMANFMIAHLNDGEYDGHRILQSDTARAMHSTAYTSISPAINRMVLGFFQLDRNGHRIIGHDGDTRFFHSALSLFLDENVGLFISLNSAGRDSDTFGIREKLFHEFTDRYFPGPGRTGEMSPAIAKAHAALMAGQYDGSRREDTTFVSFVNLLSQVGITADDSGHLVTSMTGLNGEQKKFKEIAPFLWHEVGGKNLLAAKVKNGKVLMWGEGDDPSGAYTPTPQWRNATWLMPLLKISILTLLLATIAWPVTALARHGYGVHLALKGEALQAFRWTRVAVASQSVVIAAWLAIILGMMATFYVTWLPYFVSSPMEKWILAAHLLSIVVFPLATLVTLWNVRVTFRAWNGRRHTLSCLWSLLIAASSVIVLYAAGIFHFIGFGLAF